MGLPLPKNNETHQAESLRLDFPNIYAFHDYRKFIRAWVDWKRSQTSGCSIRSLSIEAGFNESYLSLVVRGQRNLTMHAQNKLLKALELDKRGQSFFKLLVQLSDSRTMEEKLEAVSRMHRYKKYQKAFDISSESYRYLSHWYFVAIREMTTLADFKLEPKWIQKKLNDKVPLKEIQKAINFLVSNKYIQLNKDGQIVGTQPPLDCSGGIYKIAMGEFHKQMFELATKVTESTPRDLRLIDANTFGVTSEDIPVIKNILSSAIDQVIDYMDNKTNKSKNEMVYHVAFAGFPLTKKDGES